MSFLKQKGLSLLELLVVFVIISMVSTVLLQGFGYGLALYERVESRGQQIVIDSLSSKWFRHTNGALIPSKQPGESLVGDSRGFSAVTINPLIGIAGLPTEIRWEQVDDVLVYKEGGKNMAIRRLPSGSFFQFRSIQGRWLNAWPVDVASHRLPTAIRVWGDGDPLITVVIKGRLYPDLLLEESRRER